MKEIINYYYNFALTFVEENSNYTKFNYEGEEFYFVFFNRSVDELDDLINITYELKSKGIRVHEIILNREGEPLTKVGDAFYILLKLNCNSKEEVNLFDLCNYQSKLKLNNVNSKLYRNNWGELWSEKVDYFEYQIREMGKDKKIIVESLSYYLGLAENAISYANKINKVMKKSDFDNIVLSHRRIFSPNTNLNFLNPLSFIFDLEVRDVAEFLKAEFFCGKDCLIDLETYLKIRTLTPYSYHMLYARLLYPSYYFDLYELVMNNNDDEEKIINVVKKVQDYEKFLQESYKLISKYTNLERIDWILKEEL